MSHHGVGDPSLLFVLLVLFVRNDVKLFTGIFLLSIFFTGVEIVIFRIIKTCCYLIGVVSRRVLQIGFSLVLKLNRFRRGTNVLIYRCRYAGGVRKKWYIRKKRVQNFRTLVLLSLFWKQLIFISFVGTLILPLFSIIMWLMSLRY